MFYIDWLYIILVLPPMIFAMWASFKVNSTFKKYSVIPTVRGITGADAARRILFENGIYDVRIEYVAGNLTDHYDPKNKVLRLSEATYNSSSAAAVGVAAHEAGHAIQHAKKYIPLRVRNAIVPITNIGSRLAFPLILLGIILSAFSQVFAYVSYAGVACFGLVTLFQLLTLPTEFNASKRAIRCIRDAGVLEKSELSGAKKVLSAAAMTYVAALAVSFAQLLRFFLMVALNTRRRD
ncbi:MAG: zinc metallopeptidase [Clostridia bacterium]|nr:zinc metallopeptidase [Clostridia bacterium]